MSMHVDFSRNGNFTSESHPVSLSEPINNRPRVKGKFIFIGDKKFYVRGVTYGTFRPDEEGTEYNPEKVEEDFRQIAANGFNSVRTYTVPPRWLLDKAQECGLYVMVGLPWEQHITFLDDKKRVDSIKERVRKAVRNCAGHPAVLCYAIGNEIPTQIVRWHGKRRVERFLRCLYNAAKAEDPAGLVTYVNYPSTEYLELPFVDFLCFNVYLESQEKLEAYLARLQNIAGDRPLVLAEIGLDSRRNGEQEQAKSLDWQIRCAFAGGCAGAFVFAWTDEWHRGGHDIEDWDFGLTTRDRRPKPALEAVHRAFAELPLPSTLDFPRISVVVCSYNGALVIRDCLEGLAKLDYPNYEVIIVNDGSTDETEDIANEYSLKYGFRVLSSENRGLSSARNSGMTAATGEIIAYIDDDAYPDPDWLTYIAVTFLTTEHAGVGGPNIAPPGDGTIADCVANSPGGPVHVLLTDTVAEHIPGCNSAYRKSCLQAIGGWDPQFRTAGDDVDVCWRLQEKGWTIGFNPAAVVWHHRRNSVRAYWKQQVGYGRAEALLEKKWPEKYNALGHVSWAGRLYGKGLTQMLPMRSGRIYQGTWGSAPFQSLEKTASGTLRELPMMPEWFLVVGTLAAFSFVVNILWVKLVALPLLVILFAAAPFVQACLSAARASFSNKYQGLAGIGVYSLTAFLHILQPLARLGGRLRYGLTLWRKRGKRKLSMPRARLLSLWSENWKGPEEWLLAVESRLRAQNLIVRRGGNYDDWDLEVRSGTLGSVRTRMTIEEHGAGKQLVRFRSWPTWSLMRLALIAVFAMLSIIAAFDGALAVSALLGMTVILLVFRKIRERVISIVALKEVIEQLKIETEALSQAAAKESAIDPSVSDEETSRENGEITAFPISANGGGNNPAAAAAAAKEQEAKRALEVVYSSRRRIAGGQG